MDACTRRADLSAITLPSGIKPAEAPNAGLWLDKFIFQQSSEPTSESRLDRNRRITPKARLIEDVTAIPIPSPYIEFFERWKKLIESICPNAGRGIASVQGRMAIGLGDETVLETSVKLHRTYGVPYIPGSSLKGLAASYARNRIGGDWTQDKQAYQIVFGKMEDAGYITFHDALYLPTSANGHPLRPDVITVHHPDYYANKKTKDAAGNESLSPPADWDDPIPLPFLSATGDYLIALSTIPEGESWLKPVWRILKLALEHEGVGAKTSSGYGRMLLRNA